MKIRYDAEADAAYLYLSEVVDRPATRQVTDDVFLDFDDHGRLLGVEVLDASKHLDLSYLEPVLESLNELGVCWHQLRNELVKRRRAGQPIATTHQVVKYRIKEVTDDYVALLPDKSKEGKSRTITRNMQEDGRLEVHRQLAQKQIIMALWDLGGYPFLHEARR